MNYAQWQQQARSRLEAAGFSSDEAHATARLALDYVTGTRYAALMNPDELLGEESSQRLGEVIQQLLDRSPFPHITGVASFWGKEWNVSPATLIPRPETEFLIDSVLKRLRPNPQLKVVDLGTGSGIIAITLALELKLTAVWATEISSATREIAQANAEQHGVKLNLLQGDANWLQPIQALGPFDAIVSNPPYIPSAEIETLQPEVRDHEPRAALDGGADGLEPYRQFAQGARELLTPEGFIACEIGAGQFTDIQRLFTDQNWHVESPVHDLAGHERVFVAKP